MTIARGLLGLVFFCLVAWGLSSDRKKFPWRIVVFGLGLQALLGAVILGTDVGGRVFVKLSAFVQRLIEMAKPGARLVFGPLSDPESMEPVMGKSGAFIFAFAGQGLVAIIFFSALMAVLYHLGVMQLLVYGLAKMMTT
ncbi:MAG: Na+ dependent nucleoside transporter N-terminal domain-containing protein, partial [Planctomycetaceae bacterium]